MKFILMLKDGNFLAENGETAFASMALMFHNETVAKLAACGIVGAKVVPLKTLGTYQHESLRESHIFRHLEAE